MAERERAAGGNAAGGGRPQHFYAVASYACTAWRRRGLCRQGNKVMARPGVD